MTLLKYLILVEVMSKIIIINYQMVKDLGIVPGVTLDKGWIEMPGTAGKEVYTQGMDDLDERYPKLSTVHKNHAHFQM